MKLPRLTADGDELLAMLCDGACQIKRCDEPSVAIFDAGWYGTPRVCEQHAKTAARQGYHVRRPPPGTAPAKPLRAGG